MQYRQIIEYLYSQLPMFHRVGPAAYKANLDNTIALSKYLGNPEKNFRSIHIAGTNGKGSVAHMIASVLQEKGVKTGLCTSPHLKDFRERMKINGVMIPKEYISDFFENHFEFINKSSPSFFELTIALTFKYFADEKVDIAAVETGMGGRLDSTNIIEPLASVITNIGLDHTNLLGDTLEKIAVEKAGIIKPNIPVIIGETQKKTTDIFKVKAEENNSDLFFADQAYNIFPAPNDNDAFGENYRYTVKRNSKMFSLEAALGGACQAKNIAATLQCVDVINEKYNIGVSTEHLRRGLKNVIKNTGLMGRWQILQKQPPVICDTGHNTEAIQMILHHLNNLHYERLHIVIGLMNDKNIEDVLRLLPTDAVYYFSKADLPRALSAEKLKDEALKFGLYGQAYHSVKKALNTAKEKAGKNDLVFIGGSTFVVAEVL